jgi:rRNA-processing protein FCF1
MMSQLSSNLDSMGARLGRRISDIESNVEKILTAKFNTVITERVKGEVNKVKEEVRTEIDNLKENFKRLDKAYAEIVSKENTIENVDSNRTKAININFKT